MDCNCKNDTKTDNLELHNILTEKEKEVLKAIKEKYYNKIKKDNNLKNDNDFNFNLIIKMINDKIIISQYLLKSK